MAEVTVGSAGIATFSNFCSNPDNLSAYYIDFSEAENIEAYKAKVESNTVILTKTDKVLAGEGVLLRSLKETDEATTEWLPIVYGTTDKTDDNDFVGVKTATTLETTNGNITNFVLSRQEDGNIGFYKANNTLVPAGKAYLPVPDYTPSSADAKGLRLVFDDGTATDIDIAEARLAKEDGAYYTLSGVKVENPTAKGIYIKNGKKYIIK